MRIVVNSSPLIFLARLGFLEKTINLFKKVYISQSVVDEISVKQDEASKIIKECIKLPNVEVRSATLKVLASKLNERFGKGESETIALAIELQTEQTILDDFSARKEAIRLGLKVKGTLGIIRKLQLEDKFQIDN